MSKRRYQLRCAELAEGIDKAYYASESVLAMCQMGADPATRETLEKLYEMLWHLGGRINRALRVKARLDTRRRKKLQEAEGTENPPAPAVAENRSAEGGAAAEADARGGQARRKTKRQQFAELVKRNAK